MIIKRRYEAFRALALRDPEARELLKKYSDDERTWEEYVQFSECILHNAEMGCGIRNPKELSDMFDKMDKENPYDNGLNYNNANKVYVLEASRKGNAAIFLLIDTGYGEFERVVDIFAIDNKSGEKMVIEPWDVPRWR